MKYNVVKKLLLGNKNMGTLEHATSIECTTRKIHEGVVEKEKSMTGSLLFLGTGASTGVPVIGCMCSTCQSKNGKNNRTRPSVVITVQGKKFLIDVGPDFRQQALRYAIPRPDAICISHTHYDHVGGLDELRSYSFMDQTPMPCFLSHESLVHLQRSHFYHFLPKHQQQSSLASLSFHPLPGDHGEYCICGIPVQYASHHHGVMDVLGFRIANCSYITDIKKSTDETLAMVYQSDVLVISAACAQYAPTQLTIEEALAFRELVRPKTTYLTHLSHKIEYDTVAQLLPTDVFLAYDGLEVTW